MGQAITPDPSRANLMTTRFDSIGLAGRPSDEGNVVDSYIKTYEFKINPTTDEVQTTELQSPTAFFQVVSAFIVIENGEAVTIDVGIGSIDNIFSSGSLAVSGAIGTDLYSPIQGGGDIEYKLSSVAPDLQAHAVITLVGYDLDED